MWEFLDEMWMQINIFNAQTNFQVSICITLDATRGKPILIVKFTKCRVDYKWEKIHLPLIHLRIGIFQKFFFRWIKISVMHSSTKNHWSNGFEIKGRGREKFHLIAQMPDLKIDFICNFKIESLKSTRKHCFYSYRLSLRKIFTFLKIWFD